MKKRRPAPPQDDFDRWDVPSSPEPGFWRAGREGRPTTLQKSELNTSAEEEPPESPPATAISAAELDALQKAQRAAEERRQALEERGLSRDTFFIPGRRIEPEIDPDSLLPSRLRKTDLPDLEPLTAPDLIEEVIDTFRPAAFEFTRTSKPKPWWRRLLAFFF